MKRKMVWTGISFIAGMFFASAFNKYMQIPVMLSVLLVSAFFFWKEGKKFIYYSVCALCFTGGTVLYELHDVFVFNRIIQYEDQNISFSGTVTDISYYADERVSYRIRGKINGKEKTDLMYYGPSEGCDYSDSISFECVPSVFENTFLFNSRDYYRSSGCFLKTDKLNRLKTAKESRFSVLKSIRKYRDKIENKISLILPGDNGALITAMLTGSKDRMKDSSERNLYRCGTGHMMAVSGMHLVLITSFLAGLLKRMKIFGVRKFILTELLILVFVIFSGMSVSVTRAAFMLTLIYGAELFGRQADPLNSLCIASVILLIRQPFLIENASFLLSVSGTFGAAVFAPYVTENIDEEGAWHRLKKRMITVFCISACVFPFSVMFFDEVSLLSPLSDIILIPLCTAALVCGFITAAAGGTDIIAYPAMMAGGLLSRLVYRISSFLAYSVPSVITVKREYIPVLTLVLAAFVILTALKFRKQNLTFYALAVSALIFSVSSVVYGVLNRNVLSVYRVGDARTAAVAVFMGNRADIIDLTGSSRSSDYVLKLLQMSGKHRIDSVVMLKNPYQSMASFTENLASDRVSHVFVPVDTYTDYGTGICGCEPEFFSSEGINLERDQYRIKSFADGTVSVFYNGREIKCSVSEINADGYIYRENNIEIRASVSGGTDVYTLN